MVHSPVNFLFITFSFRWSTKNLFKVMILKLYQSSLLVNTTKWPQSNPSAIINLLVNLGFIEGKQKQKDNVLRKKQSKKRNI